MIATLDQRTTTIPPNDAAARLGVTPETLANWRARGYGPPYVKIGSRVRYLLCDLAAFIESHTRTSTSSPGPRE